MKKSRQSPLSVSKKKKLSFVTELQNQMSPKCQKSKMHVAWMNKQGMECKRIIEPNRCFCTHSFECHETVKTIGSAFCLTPGCQCKCYEYVPYYDIKCMCRHSYKDHDRHSRMCKMCNKCLGFVTNWSCKCGMKYQLHQTVFQIKKEFINKSERNKSNSTPKSSNRKVARFDDYQQTQQDEKQNKPQQSRFLANKSIDAQTFQMTKFQLQLNKYTKNQNKMQEHKRKMIDRINEKFGSNNFQKQVQKEQQMQFSKIYRPDNARGVTPLQMYIRPHNYHPVKLQKFLEKEYRKYQQSKINISALQ